MGTESEGLLTGTNIIVAVLLASMLVIAFNTARSFFRSHTSDVANTINGFSESDFSAFNDNDVSGHELWEQFRTLSGCRSSNQYYTIRVTTGTADVTWTSDMPIAESISDCQQAINYVGEDSIYHCTLIRANGSYGEILGIHAQLIL